ncbi:phage tail protein I [Maridesulfovibrio ferrireducens]|uniref:phage tail protein I n=1 Tax=Maridesulfovibrio ferrireducens TaxID=246191 RepID=UPI001A2247C9|nr:phage tail protein I [Maridesulfovibrio ferrireducens]MBI9110117.1 phage tail protein I [Maridesulfovibrio ferrireducens]
MSDLLPISATKQERDLSNAVARIEVVPVDIRDLWNPDKCPVVFLPWLAWSLSVDLWKDSWPEETKRAVIKASIAIHRIKGTPVAVEKYLEALGISADVLEWFEYDGDEYKFKVRTFNRMANVDYYKVLEAVSVSKNVRSHLDAIQVPHDSEAQPSAVGLPLLGISINGHIWIDVKIKEVPTYATGVPLLGVSLEAKMPDPTIRTNQENIYSSGFVRLGNQITGVMQ